MGLFRRRQGKHALGAAVTSVPSGPLRVVDVTPPPIAAAPPPAPAPPPPPVVEAAEPDLMTSISALIASGEAWADRAEGSPRDAEPARPLPPAPAPRVTAPPAVPAPGAVPLPPAASLAGLPDAEPPRPVAPAHVAPAPASAVQPLPAAQRPLPTAPSPRSALEAALAELQGARGEPVVAAGPKVQLGFRDGTSTTLDPTSSQSLALEQLAQSLTRRD